MIFSFKQWNLWKLKVAKPRDIIIYSKIHFNLSSKCNIILKNNRKHWFYRWKQHFKFKLPSKSYSYDLLKLKVWAGSYTYFGYRRNKSWFILWSLGTQFVKYRKQPRISNAQKITSHDPNVKTISNNWLAHGSVRDQSKATLRCSPLSSYYRSQLKLLKTQNHQ